MDRGEASHGETPNLDNAKFVSNARGSCWEVLDHLIAASDEGLIENRILSEGRSHIDKAIRLLNGYLKYLKSAATNNQ